VTAYRVRPNRHSRAYPWQWECLHAVREGVDPRPVRCLGHGLARTEAEAGRLAAQHATTHQP
jgi:hypothetical protein